MSSDKGWFSVRTVFEWVHDGDGDRCYEERITLWRAATAEEAMTRAEAEAVQYIDQLDGAVVGLGLLQSYAMDSELTDGADGAEVFSLLRDSPLEPAAYLASFFDTGREHQQTVRDDPTE